MLVHGLFDSRFYFGRHQFVLGLRGKLGIGDFHGDHRGQAFPRIIAGGGHLRSPGQTFPLDIAVERPRERCPESGQVRSTVPLGNIVGVTENIFLERVIPLQGDFDTDTTLLHHFKVNWLVNGRLVQVKVTDECTETAVVAEILALA